MFQILNIVEKLSLLMKIFIRGGLLHVSYIDIVHHDIDFKRVSSQTLGRSLFLIWGIEVRRPKFIIREQ